jgi:hypothetical protein
MDRVEREKSVDDTTVAVVTDRRVLPKRKFGGKIRVESLREISNAICKEIANNMKYQITFVTAHTYRCKS